VATKYEKVANIRKFSSLLPLSYLCSPAHMISKKDVQYIARLARIELTEAERAKFEKELSAILEFVAKLGEVDTSAVESLSGGTELTNVLREDVPPADSGKRMADSPERLVGASPRKRDGYVEVPAVFERA